MPQAQDKKVFIDISFSGEVQGDGIAYKEDGETVEDVITKATADGHTVIGFEWEAATKTLGVICK